MASEIKVDTVVNAGGDNDTGIDLATNDQILLKVANATRLTMNSTGQTTIVGEGGTTTTSLQQGLCKCWVQFDGSASGAAAIDSFNLTGMTDGGTGDYTITIANNMNNAGYSVPCAGDDRNHNHVTHTIATGSFGFRGRVGVEGSTANNADTPEASCAVFGDLA